MFHVMSYYVEGEQDSWKWELEKKMVSWWSTYAYVGDFLVVDIISEAICFLPKFLGIVGVF
jgi:hypothetical protein